MMTFLGFMGAVALFLLGLRLSGFFSGSETGFYRVSSLRLNIDAQAGDRTAARILWFAQNPSYFVATTLVGNNIANYITTVAIGLAVVIGLQVESGWAEIVGTLLLSPVVFVFGELVPKYLYLRAPLQMLRKDTRLFLFFFRLFLVVSFPLIWITKLFERFGSQEDKQLNLVLGRSRLVQVLSRGHREGLLSDVQGRLVHGLMHTAAQRVRDAVIPASRVLGVADDVSREEMLQYAKQYGMTSISIRRADSPNSWYGYLRVIDLAVSPSPPNSLIRNMPTIPASASKLEALLELRNSGAAYGVVAQSEETVGIISERGLVEQLFRAPQAAAVGSAAHT